LDLMNKMVARIKQLEGQNARLSTG